MWIGSLELDLLLGDVHSLKEKRSVVRPIISDVRRRFQVSVAEVDHPDLYRRSAIGVAVVASEVKHVIDVLDEVERFLAARSEVELLSARRTVLSNSDE